VTAKATFQVSHEATQIHHLYSPWKSGLAEEGCASMPCHFQKCNLLSDCRNPAGTTADRFTSSLCFQKDGAENLGRGTVRKVESPGWLLENFRPNTFPPRGGTTSFSPF
jgi:hypothetical protein